PAISTTTHTGSHHIQTPWVHRPRSGRRSFMKVRCPQISSASIWTPTLGADGRRQSSRHSGTGPGRITTSRLCGIALLAMMSSTCRPRPTRAYVTTPSGELIGTASHAPAGVPKMPDAKELADLLPDWRSTTNPQVHL